MEGNVYGSGMARRGLPEDLFSLKKGMETDM